MRRSVGQRIFTNVKKPNSDLIDQFRGIPSSNIGDTMSRLYCMDNTIKPMNSYPLLGAAFTVKVPGTDNLMFHRALDLAEPGDVLVIDAQGCMDRAMTGEIMVKYAIAKKLAGVVINGCVRDSDELRNLPIPIYCKGVTPQGPYKNGPGEINVPVCCGGQAVLPGDILVGDQDGIVVIRQDDALEVLAEAKEKFQMEIDLLQRYSENNFDFIEHDKAYSSQTEKDYVEICAEGTNNA